MSYQAMPLTESALDEKLQAPTMSYLAVEARQIRHPLLKPVKIDEANGLTPDGAAVLAVLVNHDLQVERDKKGVSAAQLFLAGILPNPQFGASMDFPVGGDTRGTVNAYGLTLDYDVATLITRGVRMDAASLHSSSVALDVAWQEWQVAEAAKKSAYRQYLLERQLRIIEQEEAGLRQNLATVQRAVTIGATTVVDLSAAQASLEKVHLSVLGIRQNLAQERFALQRAIGFEPGRLIPLRDRIELPRISNLPTSEEILENLEDRRLDLIALRIGYQSQEQTLRAAILGQFPRISIGTGQARDTGNVITQGLSLTIGLPFFDRNQGNIAMELATRRQLFDEYVVRLYDARSTVARLRADIQAIAEQIRATEAYLPIQRKLVATYHDALLNGNADVLNYYSARDELIATRVSLLDLQLNLVDRFVALEIAAGEFLFHAANEEINR